MAVSVVQRTLLGNAAATSTIAKAFGSNMAAGNAVIAIGQIGASNLGEMATISDSQGLTYNLVNVITGTSVGFKVYIAYGSSAAANTVTLTTGTNASNLFIFEVSGLAASLAFDKSAFANQSSATALDSGSTATLANTNNLIIGVTGNVPTTGLAPTVGAGYSNLQTLTTGFMGGGSEEKIVASTAAVNATFGLAANSTNETTAVFAFSDTANTASSYGAFTFVQSKSANGNSTAPSAVFTATPTQNNLLVAGVYSTKTGTITMSSTGWTTMHNVSAGSGGSTRSMRMFYKIAGAGESTTVTATVATGPWEIAIAEYTGNAASPYSIDAIQSTVSGVTHATPSVTPDSQTSIVIVGFSAVQTANDTFSNEVINSSTTGVTEREDTTNAGNGAATLYDKFVTSSTGAYSGAADETGGTGVGAGAIAIFKAAVSTGVTPNVNDTITTSENVTVYAPRSLVRDVRLRRTPLIRM